MRLTRCFNFAGKVSSALSPAAGRKRRLRQTILICAAVAAGSATAGFEWHKGRGKGSLDHHLGCHTCSALVG